MEPIRGLAPVIGGAPRLLILGAMPSVLSLERAEYYGNPRNAFWAIQCALAEVAPVGDYEERCRLIMDRGIALWDVLAQCERKGSLDSAIQNPMPNDLAALLARYPGIGAIALNGRTAEKLFTRFFAPLNWQGPLISLPSTSPANTMPFAEKLARWRVINDYLK